MTCLGSGLVGQIGSGIYGRAPVDLDPLGTDGLPNLPGVAVVGDPNTTFPLTAAFCTRVLDYALEPLAPVQCQSWDGRHMAFNLDQLFPEIGRASDATLEFFLDAPAGLRADVLVIDVTDPNQFRSVPVTILNPACDLGTLCLSNGRFRVEVEAKSNSNVAQGSPMSVNDDSGLFFFPQLGDANFEMLVSVMKGCGFNDHFWVFAAATTNVEYTLTVTDTQTNITREYENPLGAPAPAISDTTAFATCP